jgi:hypothetical protein
VVVGNQTDLISDLDNATTTMKEDALRLIDELVPPSDMLSTSRSPATPVNEREWLPSHVVSGSDDDEMCVHTNGNLNLDTTSQSESITPFGRDELPQRLAPTLPRTPPTLILKPTRIPQFPPTHFTSWIDLFALLQTHIQIPLAQTPNLASQRTVARSARPTHGLHFLPHSHFLLFR